ncbi:MAG TPA: 2-oxoacid:acceptor oxidoreductase family protein [Acidobacteriota bacterium]|nr:2-oxoacid:acceptor oxidoreductase family protein [Acidobacteriota bacterium]
MNIYMTGVGGQGIGLLSEALLRAISKAGMAVRGVDTHGLAQRGGVVVSHIRTGDGEFSPLIAPGEADLVLALERHEAFRAVTGYLKDGGALAYYDAEWQPFETRNGSVPHVGRDALDAECAKRNIRVFRAFRDDIPDSRMQNTALLKEVLRHKLIPGLDRRHIAAAMEDLLSGRALEANLEILAGQ